MWKAKYLFIQYHCNYCQFYLIALLYFLHFSRWMWNRQKNLIIYKFAFHFPFILCSTWGQSWRTRTMSDCLRVVWGFDSYSGEWIIIVSTLWQKDIVWLWLPSLQIDLANIIYNMWKDTQNGRNQRGRHSENKEERIQVVRSRRYIEWWKNRKKNYEIRMNS